MNATSQSMVGVAWARFVLSIKSLVSSDAGGRAVWLFAALVGLLFASNGLNVLNSYVGRNFMTAIADRRMQEFLAQATLYVGVFGLSTVVGVLARYAEESLGLLWRECLTRHLLTFYLQDRIYFHMGATDRVANPDQRIAEDVRTYTATTLSFALLLLNSCFTVVAFSGVLWSISPRLFLIAILYSLAGSLLTVVVGKRLVQLNYDLLDKEANFRSTLMHVRDNAESVALLHREHHLRDRLLAHFGDVVDFSRRIIRVNRNVGSFTTGYNYLIQIIPALIVAPLFINGDAEFGVVTQSAMAFSTLVGAFSIIITQFQSISAYAAVGTRLSNLAEGIESLAPVELKPVVGNTCGICLAPERVHREALPGQDVRVEEGGERLVLERLTLSVPGHEGVLVRDLSMEVAPGLRVLVAGPGDAAKVALFRGVAGLWAWGSGVIRRPHLEDFLFLPERPYLPPGTLRQALLRRPGAPAPDARLLEQLRALDILEVVERAGGLDQEHNWGDILSLGEQQLLAIASVLLAGPRFVMLDRPDTTLNPQQLHAALRQLTLRGVAYLTIGDGTQPVDDYDLLVELDEDGGVRHTRLRD